MSTEVGVPGKTIHYLNLHKEGTSSNSFCEVNENWNGKILDKQSDYLVAISRFEVPMNRVPINREIKNAVEIFRYWDAPIQAKFAVRASEDEKSDAVLDAAINLVPRLKGLNLRMPAHVSVNDEFTYEEMMARGPVNFLNLMEAHPCQPTKNSTFWFNNPEVMVGRNKKYMIDQGGGQELNTDQLVNDGYAKLVSSNDMDTYFANVEKFDALNLTKLNPIDLPPCHTVLELLTILNGAIQQRLLQDNLDIGDTFLNYNTITAFANNVNTRRNPSAERYNTYGTNNPYDGFDESNTDPIAMFQIKISGDYRFSVEMNLAFSQTYYIKLHPELFRMFQFKEMGVADLKKEDFFYDAVTEDQQVHYNRSHLRGRRFLGDRLANGNRESMASLRDRNRQTNEYRRFVRDIGIFDNRDSGQGTVAAGPGTIPLSEIEQRMSNFVYVQNFQQAELRKMFTAAVSASDSLTRVKSIVFQSSLPTRSESSSGATYQHFLTDFTLPTASSFTFNTDTLKAEVVSEN